MRSIECIFCRIIKGEVPSEILLETDDLVAIRDINPQAPYHILIIPKMHISNLYDSACDSMQANIFRAARELASDLFDHNHENGFRLVCNTGIDGGQTVDHLHFHLLGGRALGWPPG